MEVISQPLYVGKSRKMDLGPNQMGYETCSEEKVVDKPTTAKPGASTILKERIVTTGDVSMSSPILGTKRKQGSKEANNKKMATRVASQLVEMQVTFPLKLDGEQGDLDSLVVDLEVQKRRSITEEIVDSICKIQMLVVVGKGKKVFVSQEKVSSSQEDDTKVKDIFNCD